jgi:hypothetical protein
MATVAASGDLLLLKAITSATSLKPFFPHTRNTCLESSCCRMKYTKAMPHSDAHIT